MNVRNLYLKFLTDTNLTADLSKDHILDANPNYLLMSPSQSHFKKQNIRPKMLNILPKSIQLIRGTVGTYMQAS